MEIVDDRDDNGSLLITSQVPVSRWHEIIGDSTLGDAILARIVHRAHRIDLKGESLRKRQALAVADSLTNAQETWDLFNRQWQLSDTPSCRSPCPP
jgi:hypothetical protein